jgi:phenylalanyl-tRNA synthetase beta chain
MDPVTVQVSVPSFRQDVTMLADLCEEVARVYGYDNIPFTLMADPLPKADPHPEIELEQDIRTVLIGCGLDEIITYSLTSMEAVALVNPAEGQAEKYLRLSNAITPEREYLRRSLLPTMLEALAMGLRERERVMLFEIGHIYLPRTEPGKDGEWLPDEPRRLGLAIGGPRDSLHWRGTSSEAFDFFDLKGIMETLLARLKLEQHVSFVPLTDDERLHPGRAARLVFEPESQRGKGTNGQENVVELGVIGELHPEAHERLELVAPRAVIAEIDLDALIGLVQQRYYTPISRYPASKFDLALVVADDLPASQVAATIRRGAGNLLESLALFDVYSGAQVGEGKRSLAYRLTFRAADRTLKDDDLAKIRGKIVKLLQRELEAAVRA